MSRKYGNAQTIGNNIYQTTYFMTKDFPDCFFVAMADGTIDSVTGACASILACESVAKGFSPTENIGTAFETQFIRTALSLKDKLYKGRPPRVSLLSACFYRDRMMYRGVGELSVVCFDGGRLSVLSGESGTVELGGKLILLCNRGVWQALSEVEVEELLSGTMHPFKKAQRMIEAINKKNLKDQKSTVLMII